MKTTMILYNILKPNIIKQEVCKMGLDMSVEKIIRVTEEELKNLTGKHCDDIINAGYNVYSKEMVETREEIIVPIISYLTEIQYIETYINLANIKRDYNIPEDACISGQCACADGSAGYTFKEKDDFFHVELTCEEVERYVMEEEVKGFVCKAKELAYWRKNYVLHQQFEQRCETPVRNCVYAPIPYDLLIELAEYDGQVTMDDITGIEDDENSIIVYHPWW